MTPMLPNADWVRIRSAIIRVGYIRFIRLHCNGKQVNADVPRNAD